MGRGEVARSPHIRFALAAKYEYNMWYPAGLNAGCVARSRHMDPCCQARGQFRSQGEDYGGIRESRTMDRQLP